MKIGFLGFEVGCDSQTGPKGYLFSFVWRPFGSIFDVCFNEFFDVVLGRFLHNLAPFEYPLGVHLALWACPLAHVWLQMAPLGVSLGHFGGSLGPFRGVTWPLKGRLGGPGRLFAPKWSPNGATCVQNVRKLVCISGKFAALASSSAISLQPFVYTVGPGGLRGAIKMKSLRTLGFLFDFLK